MLVDDVYEFGLIEAVIVFNGAVELLLLMLDCEYDAHRNMYHVRRSHLRKCIPLSSLKDYNPLQIWTICQTECVILKWHVG